MEDMFKMCYSVVCGFGYLYLEIFGIKGKVLEFYWVRYLYREKNIVL